MFSQNPETAPDDNYPASPSNDSSYQNNGPDRLAVQVVRKYSYLRILGTVYFYICLFLVSALACFSCVVIKASLAVRRFLLKESTDILEEHVRGQAVDFWVWILLKLSSILFRMERIGNSGHPSFSLAQDEWATWRQEHQRKDPATNIQICSLPRDANNNVRLPGGTMILCNHLSNVDGFAMKAALFPSASKAIIKGNVKKIPFVGWLVTLSNEPVIYFTKNKGGWATTGKEELLARCEEVLKRDFPLVIYPEGVRRQFGRMAPFRHGMIRFAMERGYPMYVAVIHGSHRIWPVGSPFLNFGTIYVNFAEEIILPSKDDDIQSVCECARSMMVKLLAPVPGYDAVAEAPITSLEEYQRLEQERAESKRRKKKVL